MLKCNGSSMSKTDRKYMGGVHKTKLKCKDASKLRQQFLLRTNPMIYWFLLKCSHFWCKGRNCFAIRCNIFVRIVSCICIKVFVQINSFNLKRMVKLLLNSIHIHIFVTTLLMRMLFNILSVKVDNQKLKFCVLLWY